MTNRERFLRLMRGEPLDRAPFFPCFGPWPATLERWHDEGLPRDADWRQVCGFDGDMRQMLPINGFLCPQFPEQIIEETEEYRVFTDRFGVRKRDRQDGGSMPEFLGYAVESRADWERLRDERLQPAMEGRLASSWPDLCTGHADRTEPYYAGDLPIGFFGGPRELLGVERLCMWFYDEPALLEEIMDHLCDLWIAVYTVALAEAPVDFFFIWEDMCFKNGPLVSPALFRKFLVPRYRRFTAALRDAGADIIMVDSDGDVRLLIDDWLAGGITCLFPWETQMGLDITAVRRKYPALQMIGGVNKAALAHGREAIDAALEPIPFILRSGRFLPAVDHFVPPDVSWDNYRYFCEQLRRMIEQHPPTP
jgi:hypothetical protein